MREKRQDLSLKRAQAHIRRVLESEEGRPDAAATYSLVATQLLAASLKLQPGPAAARFLHGVWVQLRDDLRNLGIELPEMSARRGLTG
jgi:hypothetical protein